ncbi:MAG: NACHT domain-containing protein, partial [Planctomycetota bacterium]
SSPFEVDTRVLYAIERRVNGETEYDGRVEPLRVRAFPEFQPGCYLDPVSLGLVCVDRSMLKSLELAWRRVSSELRPLSSEDKAAQPSLRVSPTIPNGIVQLSGGSAGAIFVCALYAAGKREELNSAVTASIGLDPASDSKDGTALVAIGVRPVSPESVNAKLRAAAEAGLDRIILHTEQKARIGQTSKLTPISAPGGLEIKRASSLDEVYRQLTGNARLDRVLARYGDFKAAAWERAWTNGAARDSKRLLYYVPPAYKIERPAKRGKQKASRRGRPTGITTRDKKVFERVYRRTEEETLARLMELGGTRLCMANAPGAGKTIFTRRLLAWASSQAGRDALAGGKPLLAVRWEEQSLDDGWPTRFRLGLAKAVDRFCAPEGVTKKAVVNWALRQGRVLVILDALDQASEERIEAFRQFLALAEQNGWNLRIVVTGRPFAVEENARLLDEKWRFGGILPFNLRQQHRYLRGPRSQSRGGTEPDAWRKRDLRGCDIIRLVDALPRGRGNDKDAVLDSLRSWFPQYDAVRQLLGNPDALHFARILAERGELDEVTGRTSLYLRICRSTLHDAAKKVLPQKFTVDDEQRWEEILAAAGFQTMKESPRHFRIEGRDSIQDFKDDVSERCKRPIELSEWNDLYRITCFHSRTVMREAGESVWAWPNRRMMEFYCGLHLARNSQPGWAQDREHVRLRCGDRTWQVHAGDSQWFEPAMHALELPAKPKKDKVLLATIAELFQPDAGARVNERRPTQLMFLALGRLREQPPHLRELPQNGSHWRAGSGCYANFRTSSGRWYAAATEWLGNLSPTMS